MIPKDSSGNIVCPCPNRSILSKIDGKVDYYCVQPNCTEKHFQSLIHFVSKDAMNIEGLGESTMKQLLKENLISCIEDIYKLKNKRQQLLELPGWKATKTDKLLKSIEASKKSGLARVLYAMGIPHVGAFMSHQLAESYLSLENLKCQSLETLTHLCGQVIGESVFSFLRESSTVKLLEFFQKEEFLLEFVPLSHLSSSNSTFLSSDRLKSVLNGKTVVISGSFEKLTQDQLQTLIRQSGGKVSSSVSKKTNYLIVGNNPGSKLMKAQQLNIAILTESDLNLMF